MWNESSINNYNKHQEQNQEVLKMKHKALKITIIVILSILLIGGIGIFVMLQMAMNSIGAGSGSVADYDKKIEIWGMVAGNSSRSKLEDMNIKSKNGNLMFATLHFMDAIVNTEYKDEEQAIDTYTYLYEIENGFEKETYEDEPYIIPYLVENSKGGIIVIPGGGFGFKSMDGSTGEGRNIALELNKAGYSAFVLHYRSNPYEYPIPQLDVQRAVRYVRFHAQEFGLQSEKIGLIGFSAGGNQVGTYINLIMGNDLFPEDYTPDEIDMVDDNVIAPAMIYPALTFDYNVPMLFSMFDDEAVRDTQKRQMLLNQMDLKQHINPNAIKQFISYGTSDKMVGMDETKAYIEAARKAGIEIVDVAAEGKDHGYTFDNYGEDYLRWLEEVFTE